MAITPAFWAGKRVLVTGHTGFKGGWLCLWLQRLGADVTGYSLAPPTKPNLFEAARVSDGMFSLTRDIRDLAALEHALKAQRPEIVFHLAAQALVRAGYADPIETYTTNVLGTVNVLEAVRRTRSVLGVVVVTSDKCYENHDRALGYRETEPMGGRDPYSSSKGCAELVTAAYRRSFFDAADAPSVATARAGNVIGGGDWAPERLIPDLVRAFSTAKPALLRNPNAVRPWQHVLDPLAGYLILGRRLLEGKRQFADAWNFGPAGTDTTSVAQIADRAVQLWGERACWHADSGPHVHEAALLILDSSKARARLGWRPKLELSDAIEWAIAWYRASLGQANMRDLTIAQIERYADRTAA